MVIYRKNIHEYYSENLEIVSNSNNPRLIISALDGYLDVAHLAASLIDHIPVVTIRALAVRGTSHATVVTFAIFLDTVRLLACATLSGDECRDVLKVTRVTVVSHHFGGFYFQFVSRLVQAPNT